jgi:hypothetical protein
MGMHLTPAIASKDRQQHAVLSATSGAVNGFEAVYA